jgi:hypothetical protein
MKEETTNSVIARLGFETEMADLRQRIARWIDGCSKELREALEWQFLTGSDHAVGSGDRAVSQCFFDH